MSDEPKRVVGVPFAKGNPGRPKGARNKLGEMFITALMTDFEKNGIDAIKRVCEEKPDAYLKVIASLMPKEVTGENGEPLLTGITVNFVKADKK